MCHILRRRATIFLGAWKRQAVTTLGQSDASSTDARPQNADYRKRGKQMKLSVYLGENLAGYLESTAERCCLFLRHSLYQSRATAHIIITPFKQCWIFTKRLPPLFWRTIAWRRCKKENLGLPAYIRNQYIQTSQRTGRRMRRHGFHFARGRKQ